MRKFIDLDLLIIGVSFLISFYIILLASKSNTIITYKLMDLSNIYTAYSTTILKDTIYYNSLFTPFYIIGSRTFLNIPEYFIREEKVAENFKKYTGKTLEFHHYILEDCIINLNSYLLNQGIDIDLFQLFEDLKKNLETNNFNYVKINIVKNVYSYDLYIETPWSYEIPTCKDYIKIIIK